METPRPPSEQRREAEGESLMRCERLNTGIWYTFIYQIEMTYQYLSIFIYIYLYLDIVCFVQQTESLGFSWTKQRLRSLTEM
jgi:hypothetical protein